MLYTLKSKIKPDILNLFLNQVTFISNIQSFWSPALIWYQLPQIRIKQLVGGLKDM